jgi:hypothetical protein
MREEQSIMKPMVIVLAALGVLILFVLAYSVISLPFTPPAPSSDLAVVPAIPLARYDGRSPRLPPGTEGKASLPDSPLPTGSSAVTPQPSNELLTVESLVKDFYSRHKSLPGKTPEYKYGGLRKDLYEIGYSVLNGSESRDTLLKLLNHPDQQVRITAVEALWDARMALGPDEGARALHRLWDQLDEQQMATAVAASVETLIQATHGGTKSNAPLVLGLMFDRALPAVPHLIWASDNHPLSQMRITTMFTARLIAPNSDATYELLQRRTADPDALVRRIAWRDTIYSWVGWPKN